MPTITYQLNLRCWSSPGWRCWRWRRCLQRGRDILISRWVYPWRRTQVKCFCASKVGWGRGVGHLGETDLSPFLLSHHRGDRDGVCLSHDQSAHRVWSQAVRWAGCSPQIGAFHYFSNSRDLLAGPSPAQEERLAARAHGLLSCGCIPVEWVENFTAMFCFNSRLIPKQWSRIHACSALISWVCMEPPLSLPPCRSFFFSLDSHRRKAPPMLASKRFSGAPNLHPHMRNFAI